MQWDQPESKQDLLRRVQSYKRPLSGLVDLGLNILGVVLFIALIVRLTLVLARS